MEKKSDSLFMGSTCEKTDNGFNIGYILNGGQSCVLNHVRFKQFYQKYVIINVFRIKMNPYCI